MLTYVIPVLAIVLLGAALRRMRSVPDGLFPAMEWFSFYVAFPALLFVGTARLKLSAADALDLSLAALLPTLLLTAVVLLALQAAPQLSGPSRSSVVQGTVRPSSYFGLAVAALLFPPETTTMVMLALAICLPVVNVIAVVALAWWGSGDASARGIARALARNPIILATLAGLLFNLSGLPLPVPLAAALDILADAALALGLLCVGGGLQFQRDHLRPALLGATSALKLLALPVLAVLVCRWLDASAPVTTAACFYAALPTASNAYIMARQMGGDAPLMASLVTWQTLLAAATVPLAMQLPRWLG
ncbi:AEC family transporter [Pseudoxanthomonas sp. LjRoot125]|uniref:AEC family transporter n=1 Tax=Pseudoxanthomonas sp. LjRoot125 TaxID=3342258 RepID=UPI003E11A999